MTDQLKVGMIGAGTVGGVHVAAWQNVKGAKLVTIADISVEKADKLAAAYGAPRAEPVVPLIIRPEKMGGIPMNHSSTGRARGFLVFRDKSYRFLL